MANIEALKAKIEESGLPMTTVAKRSNILRETLYNRMNGVGEFTAPEIVGLTSTLHLTKAERDTIFLK